MPKLLLISAATERTGLQEIGDCVGIFPDDHVFSKTEAEKFTIVEVATPELVLKAYRPEEATASRAKTIDWTVETPERKEVWKDAEGNWRETVNPPKLKTRWDGTKLVENFSRDPENLKTILIPKDK